MTSIPVQTNIFHSLMSLSRRVKIVLLVIICVFAFITISRIRGNKSAQPQYQTAVAQKGTLVTSVAASGTITTGSSATITTNASGVVQRVYVKNGDAVKRGQKIATLALDQISAQRQAVSWASYQNAKNQLASSQAKINSLQAAAFAANQKFMNDAVSRNLATTDPTYVQEYALWKQAEADYINQSGQISSANTSLSSALLSYQQVSPDILAPIDGIVNNFTLAPGVMLAAQTANASGAVSSQKVGTVLLPNGQVQASVNISEVDVVKVSPNQKVTLTLDAFPGKTFTGKVLIVDTNGQVTSGVTTYPTSIAFDTSEPTMYPNMGVTARIITAVHHDVVLIPSAAVQTQNGQTTVRVMKRKTVASVPVEVGDFDETLTQVVSGVADGDTVVTGVVNMTSTRSQTTTSPFSAFGARGGAGGGGNAVRVLSR